MSMEVMIFAFGRNVEIVLADIPGLFVKQYLGWYSFLGIEGILLHKKQCRMLLTAVH